MGPLKSGESFLTIQQATIPGSSTETFNEPKNYNLKSGKRKKTKIKSRTVSKSQGFLHQNLSKLPVIRIGVGAGAGLGDQVAAINIIENLVKFGFKGKVELIYGAEDEDNKILEKLRNKLSCLLPGFNAKNNSPQTVEVCGIECECIPKSQLHSYCKAHHSETQQALGIWPMNFRKSWLCTDYGLVIPPYGWSKVKPRVEFPDSTTKPIELTKMANYQQSSSAETSLLDIWPETDVRKEKVDGILDDFKNKHFHLMPVYGIHHGEVEPGCEVVLERLIKATKTSHKKDNEQTVLLVMSNLDNTTRLEQLAESNGADFLNLNRDSWTSLKSGDQRKNCFKSPVCLVYCGSLPKKVFEHICIKADRPLVQEGANSASFMHQLGKPYLPLLPKGDTTLPDIDDLYIPPGKKQKTIQKGLIKEVTTDYQRSSIQAIGNSLTSDIKEYCYLATAIELWDSLRPVLPDSATNRISDYFSGFINEGFDEFILKNEIEEAISYGELEDHDINTWLGMLKELVELRNNKASINILNNMKKQIELRSAVIKKRGIDLDKLINYRTTGVPIGWLRKFIPNLSLRAADQSSSEKTVCILPAKKVSNDINIHELIGDIVDNTQMLIPHLKRRKKTKDFDKIIELIKKRFFYGKTEVDNELREKVKPGFSTEDNEQLGKFIWGDLGEDYFKEVQHIALKPENNSVYSALSSLTAVDWNQIHSLY
ncbi:hypothetical protein [Endozoicomonas sp. Mp262]|uniref:hypothetical protein n=1 Tax=Endozoicomonas sp. Mp262 TaxID=2919499 RepID=UPI0021D94053